MSPSFAPAVPSGDPEALDAAVWPKGAHRNADGALVIGGVDVRDAARDFSTPVFLLDEGDFRARAAAFRSAYDGHRSDIYYAAKAFLATTVDGSLYLSLCWIERERESKKHCSNGATPSVF